MSTSDSPAVGIVGLGGMGTQHASNLAALGADVVGGSDVVTEARDEFAAAFDAVTFDDHVAMYDELDLDAVVITTPNAFHEPAATAALERDIHVLCEKPLADSLPAAERIVAADEASDAFCMVGFSNRFAAAPSLFRAYQADGEFGDVEAVEGAFVRRRGIPGLDSWFTNEDLSGGGALIDIGVHAIDYALYLAGFPDVVEVSGVTRDTFISGESYVDPDDFAGGWDATEGERDVEDSATLLLRCADDTTISLEVAWATNREPDHEFHVRGTEGGARLAIGGDELEVLGSDDRALDHHRDTTLSGDPDRDRYVEEAAAFLDGVRSGERPAMNHVEEGLLVQRVIDAVYESSERGTSVRLDEAERASEDERAAKLE
ncbi:Gfo/Idh/MocA family oxidoreductase [Halobacteria archaeon HArc-gm2]|nr:Gfo/Idh/MocA family oxidoreductase [Halobacteria archaeon HArc-gm2]